MARKARVMESADSGRATAKTAAGLPTTSIAISGLAIPTSLRPCRISDRKALAPAHLGEMRRSSSRRTRDSVGHLPRPVRRVDPTTFA